MSADLLVRFMAFVGTVVAGAFLLGWLVQLAAKLAFNQGVPRWPLWGVRTLGGVLFGFVAWWWLFAAGGGGPGGGGEGFTLFGGKGKGAADTKKDDDKPRAKDDKKKDTTPDVPLPSQTLRVEVLGDAAAKKVAEARKQSFDTNRRYRFWGQAELKTLDEVKQEVRRRRALQPPLARLDLIVYLDSPDAGNPHVTALKEWAQELRGEPEKLKVDLSFPGSNAPVD